NVYQVNGTAMGGGQSLAFSEAVGEGSMDSRLWRDDVELLQKPSDVGFSIEVLPRKFGGTLVDVGQGGQKLTLTEAGELRYQVRTEQGVKSLTSAVLSLEQWHRIAARYHAGKIELWVNGTNLSTPQTGAVLYQSGSHDLIVGEGF